ncbi:MAG: DNA (cytosine-5-)-methyltransferase [Clostridia bacterium]|nr:DNA (cytosine-5-)-methyltransferase [Clostridia bacterium]
MKVCSLFSGIGGIDLGFIQAGFEVVWANEKDPAACRTYRHNFGDASLVEGDITKIPASAIPDFDVLVAGFPCQPFSIAGKQRGFEDKRGNLFFEITRIIDAKRPKTIFLENVPNLVEHDDGRTFLVIFNSLAQFGYNVYYRVMSANEYGNIPQARKRIYIVAVHESLNVHYTHPDVVELKVGVNSIVDRSNRKKDIYYYKEGPFLDQIRNVVQNKTIIYGIHDDRPQPMKNGLCPTLTAGMGTHENRVPVLVDDFGIRKLTIRECLDFQGFPKSFAFPNNLSLQDAYKQIGNSVCVPLIKRIAVSILNCISN